jgi:large subunit ribosomal protein L29
MKASDLREKSVEDLRELQAALASGTFQNRLKNFTNRLDDTSAIRKNKRDLARVLTLLRQRDGVSTAKVPSEAPVPVAAEPTPVQVAAQVAAAPKKKSSRKAEAK